MGSIRHWVRAILLGPEDGWGATLATGRRAILVLASLAIVMQVLDLASGVRMMLVHGVHVDQNPLARYIVETMGPIGLIEVKLGVVIAGVLLFVRTAAAGRPRLARNCLLIIATVGLLGWASNLVG